MRDKSTMAGVMEMGRGYIWVLREGLINVAFFDLRPEYKRSFYLWFPVQLLCFSPSMPYLCLHARISHATGVHPITRGYILFSLSNSWQFRHSHIPYLALDKDVKGHLLRVFSENFHYQKWPCLEKLHLSVTMRGVASRLDGTVDKDKNTSLEHH